MILAYWDIRGLAQPIRLLLWHQGQEFEDRYYECLGEPGNWNRDQWLKEKFTLGLELPNLPYLIDGDFKLTQTNAIMRYLGRKFNLCGKTEEERIKVDMMADQIMDFRNKWVYMCYRTWKDDIENYEKNDLPTSLTTFETAMKGRKFCACDEVTFPDYHLFELLDQHVEWKSDVLKDHPGLSDYYNRMKDLPKLKEFFNSKNYVKLPINNKMAFFK